ncbi:MAG TPA: DUF1801 domain-containing protein [Rhodobacterales bacterium]|nr:DUF1801 domain-containing protein [Rhodobacterales bacterium]
MLPILPAPVAAAYAAFPDAAQVLLARLRALIFATADKIGAGPVEEALRWGEPAYLAPKGSTIRLGVARSGAAALFVNCRTTLIEDFKPVAPPGTRFEGTRAVLFAFDDPCDEAALALLIGRALTWHRKE